MGMEFEYLLSHSPELQPADRLWPLTNEGVANRFFADLDELDQVLSNRCVALAEQPELVRSYTLYLLVAKRCMNMREALDGNSMIRAHQGTCGGAMTWGSYTLSF